MKYDSLDFSVNTEIKFEDSSFAIFHRNNENKLEEHFKTNKSKLYYK